METLSEKLDRLPFVKSAADPGKLARLWSALRSGRNWKNVDALFGRGGDMATRAGGWSPVTLKRLQMGTHGLQGAGGGYYMHDADIPLGGQWYSDIWKDEENKGEEPNFVDKLIGGLHGVGLAHPGARRAIFGNPVTNWKPLAGKMLGGIGLSTGHHLLPELHSQLESGGTKFQENIDSIGDLIRGDDDNVGLFDGIRKAMDPISEIGAKLEGAAPYAGGLAGGTAGGLIGNITSGLFTPNVVNFRSSKAREEAARKERQRRALFTLLGTGAGGVAGAWAGGAFDAEDAPDNTPPT